MEVVEVPQLGAHAADWDAFVDAAPVPSPFLRSWWLAHVATDEPVYALVLDHGRCVGGVALERGRLAGVEVLRFLGARGPLEPDHLDLVAAPGREREVVDALRSWFGRSGSRLVDLSGLVDDARVAAAVPGRGPVTAVEVAPYVALDDDWPTYLAARNGTMRSTIKRTAKRLETAGVSFREVGPDGVDEALAAFGRLHDGRWGDESAFLAALVPFSAAIRAGFDAGEVRIFELARADGEVVACEVELSVARRLSFYQAGRLTDHDLRGSGSVLKARIIELAIAEGYTEFDLLRGGESYKTDWATGTRHVGRLRRGIGPLGVALAVAAQANLAIAAHRRRRADRADRPETERSAT